MDEVEAAILAGVVQYASDLRGNPQARANALQRAHQRGLDADQVRRDLADTREAMGRLAGRWARRQIPTVAYEAAMADLQQTEAAQESALERCDGGRRPARPGKVVKLVAELQRLWPDLLPAERNAALKTVLRYAVIRRRERWQEPAIDRITHFEWR